MLKEQAIFFEVIDDLMIEGNTEAILLAYHDFISDFEFLTVTDLEVHARAVECLERYRELLTGSELYNKRWDVLESLDLDSVPWRHPNS